MIEVLASGPLATVQDLGRPGLGHLGVGTSGAADRASLKLANRLVGNGEGAAGIEATLGHLKIRAMDATTVACTGAACPIRVGTRAGGMFEVIKMAAGDVLEIGAPTVGLRTYVAVRGGIAVPAVLGARCTDMLSGLGPPPLAAGTFLPIGPAPQGEPAVGVTSNPHARVAGELAVARESGVAGELRVVRGPRDDWFTDDALRVLFTNAYTVSARSNRVGMRMQGPVLARRHDAELSSEGTVSGALQVPPDGQPILFLADHPVTGGYPVIAVVIDDDLPLAAQTRPGEQLRFVEVRAPHAWPAPPARPQ
jgi:biotin-dependent carboxylase-like uncharacterized protein